MSEWCDSTLNTHNVNFAPATGEVLIDGHHQYKGVQEDQCLTKTERARLRCPYSAARGDDEYAHQCAKASITGATAAAND